MAVDAQEGLELLRVPILLCNAHSPGLTDLLPRKQFRKKASLKNNPTLKF